MHLIHETSCSSNLILHYFFYYIMDLVSFICFIQQFIDCARGQRGRHNTRSFSDVRLLWVQQYVFYVIRNQQIKSNESAEVSEVSGFICCPCPRGSRGCCLSWEAGRNDSGCGCSLVGHMDLDKMACGSCC